MTRDEIKNRYGYVFNERFITDLDELITAVRSIERESAAQICDQIARHANHLKSEPTVTETSEYHYRGEESAATMCAAVIRSGHRNGVSAPPEELSQLRAKLEQTECQLEVTRSVYLESEKELARVKGELAQERRLQAKHTSDLSDVYGDLEDAKQCNARLQGELVLMTQRRDILRKVITESMRYFSHYADTK